MIDYHIHTRFSQDSDAEMEAQCEAALAMGLGEVAFTEHEDYNPGDPTSFFFRHADYMLELERCRARFARRLKILAGIEISDRIATQARPAPCWPVIPGISCWVRCIGSTASTTPIYASTSPNSATGGRRFRELYFGELLDLARDGDFDVLSHLDYPSRYGHTIYGDAYDIAEYEDLLRPALRMLASRGKGIRDQYQPALAQQDPSQSARDRGALVPRGGRHDPDRRLRLAPPGDHGAHIQTALRLAPARRALPRSPPLSGGCRAWWTSPSS